MSNLKEVQTIVDAIKAMMPSHLSDIATHLSTVYMVGESIAPETVEEMRDDEAALTLGFALGGAMATLKMAEMVDGK